MLVHFSFNATVVCLSLYEYNDGHCPLSEVHNIHDVSGVVSSLVLRCSIVIIPVIDSHIINIGAGLAQ